MASSSQRRHKHRGDVETGRGCETGYAEGDGEFPRTFRNGSAGAQQCVEGRAGAHAGKYGKPAEAAAAEVERPGRVRHETRVACPKTRAAWGSAFASDSYAFVCRSDTGGRR